MSDNEVEQYESDGEDFNPKAHKKLIAGVGSLQKGQFIKKATRDEPALRRNEFNLVKSNITDAELTSKSGKVDVNDLVSVLDKTNKHLKLGKVLKKTIDKKKILPVPLQKPAAERLQRAINYEKSKEKLERWDATVAKHRSSDHLSFPLIQEKTDIKLMDDVQVPSKFRIKSDMMLEMEKIEPQIFQIPKTENDDEMEDEPELTRDELIQRSRELRQLRMKESQRSIKNHHQNKIKSKKFHRILKKEKMKQQIKEFELLQKTDPEAALRKIEQLDRSRVEERGLLRHRNTGTWAKNLSVRAKYDKDARKDLAEQIAISRELTAKKNIDESDDENETADAEIDPENDDPFNPWLKVGKSNGAGNGDVGEFLSGYRKYWQERNEKTKELADYNATDAPGNHEPQPNDGDKIEECDEIVKPPKKSISSKMLKNVKSKVNVGWIEEDISAESKIILKKSKKGKLGKKEKKQKNETQIVDNIDDLFDDAEDVIRDRAKQKLEKLKSKLKSTRKGKRIANGSDDDEMEKEDDRIDLSFKKQNQRANEDEELNGDDANNDNLLSDRITNALNSIKSNDRSGTTQLANGNNYDTENINPDDIAKVKPQHLSTALPDTVYSNLDDGFNEYDDDYHFDEEKKMTIAEAFEDDDIVAEFRREKDEENKKNGPQEIDMSLPGWGSWGGTGIDPNKQKTKRKVILRFPAQEKRRLDNQGNLVIIENRDEKLQKHLVANLPFPFTSVDDYEKSIRVPLGKDFIPATANRVLTKPAVITKSGTIIEPMNENTLVNKHKKRLTKTDRRIAKIAS